MDLAVAFVPPADGPDKRWQRATGAALVLLLHLLLLLALLHAVLRHTVIRQQRETVLTLPVGPIRQAQPEIPPTTNAESASRAIAVPPPLFVPPPGLAPPAAPDVQGLGRSLFGCAPERLADLPPDARARCPRTGVGPGDGLTVAALRSQVKNPGLRAAEMARKNAPLTVPCVSIQTRALGNTAQYHIAVVDPLCAARERSGN